MTDSSTTDGNGQGGRYRQQVEERRRLAQEEAGSQGEEAEPELSSTQVLDCLRANELGDGMLFAALHKNRFRFVKNSGEWLEWTGHYWKRDTMGNAFKACEDVARRYLQEREEISKRIGEAAHNGDKDEQKRLEALRGKVDKRVDKLRSNNGRAQTLAMAHTCENGLGITGEKLDASPWLLACANGVIDLRTGQLRNGRRDDYITIASPITWEGIDAPAEAWERSLLEIFNGQQELVDFLRRALGCAIIGRHLVKAFFVLYGPGGDNGKSLIMDIVRWVIGEFAGSIPSGLLLDQSRIKNSSGPTPDVMTLKGLRLAIASETDKEARVSTSSIKWLTGDDQIIGRNPNDKYQTRFNPTHTLFLLTNYAPHAPADDTALWGRIHLIPFDLSFVSREPQTEYERRQDNTLKDKLSQEGPGILAWIVRGCLEYQAQGLNPPPRVKAATEDYRREEDILADFIDDRCVVGEELVASANDLYSEFKEWFKENIGKTPWSQKAFGRNMSRKFNSQKSGTVKYFGVGLLSSSGP